MLSVVIVTYNRSEVLKNNLECFKTQTDQDFEIVVGIDGSTDDTVDMLMDFDCDFPLKWVDTEETDKYCLAKARNMAILETSGHAVVVIDDDSYPDPNFVEEHKKSVKQRILTGGCRSSHDPNDVMHKKMEHLLSRYGDTTPHQIMEILVENNCCMLRKDWIGCGMFSERFEGYGGCGQEFFHRLSYLGYKYQYNPRAKIYHHKEFEGDNGLTREMKTSQAAQMRTVIHKHAWSYNA